VVAVRAAAPLEIRAPAGLLLEQSSGSILRLEIFT
jgi:hypothetical protein